MTRDCLAAIVSMMAWTVICGTPGHAGSGLSRKPGFSRNSGGIEAISWHTPCADFAQSNGAERNPPATERDPFRSCAAIIG